MNTKIILKTFALCTLLISVQSLAQSRLIPHITRDGGGFETNVVVTNSSTESGTFHFTPYNASGAAFTEASQTLTGAQTLTYTVSELFGEENQISHFEITHTPDTIKVQIIYQFTETPESIAHIGESLGISKKWLVFPGDWSLVFDGIAVINKGSEATDIHLRQVSFDGQLVHEEIIHAGLPVNGKALYTIGAPGLNTFVQYDNTYFEIEGSQDLAITALRGTPPSVRPGYLWANMALPVPSESMPATGLSSIQKSADFEQLVHFVNKKYGPLFWKKELLNTDLLAEAEAFNQRILNTQSDLEFFDEMMGYISIFQDGHTGLSIPSTYVASLPFAVDIYGSKILIDHIDDASLGLAIGDELVSMDGESASTLISRLKKYTPSGFDRASRRWATTLVTVRPQSMVPRVVSGSASIEVKSVSGTTNTFTIPWQISGTPYESGKYTDHSVAKSNKTKPSILERLDRIAMSDSRLEHFTNFGKYAHLKPSFDLGPDFFVRVGNNPTYDEWYIGFWSVGDKNIGFVRIPKMSYSSNSSLQKLSTEIMRLNEDTDGLVIDVTDNPGGLVSFCNYVSRYLHREAFPQILFQMRPSLAIIHQLEQQKSSSNPPGINEYIDLLITALQTAYQNGTLTEPISLDSNAEGLMMDPAMDNFGNPVGYDKPIIVLINDLSVSGGDYLPATLQDSGRAKLVGYRTIGGGGHVVSYPYQFSYSEASISLTESLMFRSRPVSPEGYPSTSYIENVGVHPDFFYDYQNEDDLHGNGQTFVNFFTQIILDEIQQSESKK